MEVKVETDSRIDYLEKYMKKYPDVPREAIVKEDLLREGCRFTKAALNIDQPYRKKSYRLFSYDFKSHDEMEQTEYLKIPEDIQMTGGHFDLLPTICRISVQDNTPYVIDVNKDGTLVLTTDNGTVLANVEFPHLPQYYTKTFEDGTPYCEYASLVFWGTQVFMTAHRTCQYWGPDEECQFCDINMNLRQRKKHGATKIKKTYKDVEKVAKVFDEIFHKEPWPSPNLRPLSWVLTGGTILTKLNGKDEDEFYLDYIRAVKDVIGIRYPNHLQTTAKTKDVYKRYREAGVTCPNGNIEVWDKRLFKIFCPGKDRLVGRDEWIKRVCDSVEIFGEGNVIPNIVTGVEMAQPHGFKTVDEAIKSVEEGYEYLMSHGVVPRHNHWCVEKASLLAGNVSPPLDFFIRANIAWYETWNKYKLPPINGFGQMGPGRARNQNSAFLDMGYC